MENCESNSRLVVDEDDNGKFRLERVKIAYQASLLGNSIALTPIAVTELANRMKYGGGGSYITLFSPSSHSKRYPVMSLRFTEYGLPVTFMY